MHALQHTPPAPGSWVVHMNHRNRSALFAFMFFTLGSHMVDLGVGWVEMGAVGIPVLSLSAPDLLARQTCQRSRQG